MIYWTKSVKYGGATQKEKRKMRRRLMDIVKEDMPV